MTQKKPLKLYLLRPTKEGQRYLLWDCMVGFVIRAPNATAARRIAQKKGADEIWNNKEGKAQKKVPFWTSPRRVSCEELTPEGEEGVVLSDFWGG